MVVHSRIYKTIICLEEELSSKLVSQPYYLWINNYSSAETFLERGCLNFGVQALVLSISRIKAWAPFFYGVNPPKFFLEKLRRVKVDQEWLTLSPLSLSEEDKWGESA